MSWQFFRKRTAPQIGASGTPNPIDTRSPVEPTRTKPHVEPIQTKPVAEAPQAKAPVKPRVRFSAIVGQHNVLHRLSTIRDFSLSKGVAAEHFLLIGPDGMGKRTIGRAFAGECLVEAKEIDAAKIERTSDLTAVLGSLELCEVLLLRNIGSLRPNIRETLATALQHFRVDLVVGKGPGSRKHKFQLNPFTCIATATREADCPPELRESFALAIPIESYSQSELEALVNVIAFKAAVNVEADAFKLIARSSGGIPHQIEIMIQRLAKLSPGTITEKNALDLLSAYGIAASTSGLSAPGRTDLQTLTGTQFEELITSLLVTMGFRAQMTKASGDGGIDIVAVLDKPMVGGKYLIQCKRFAPTALVGGPIVREFYGAVSADRTAVKGIIITTSGFTDQAKSFAQEVGIELIDMDQLARLLAKDGMPEVLSKHEPLFPPERTRTKGPLF